MGNVRQGYSISDMKDNSSMVMKIIENMINDIVNAPFIGEVVAITGNKVDVTPIFLGTFNDIPMPPIIYNNLLIGMPYTGKTSTTSPILVGDKGLCIVTDKDITTYADTGSGGIPSSQRRFSKMDSIFIPLSMFKQEPLLQEFIFKYFGAPMNNTFKVSISNNNTLSVQGGNNGSIFKLDIDEAGNTVYDINNSTINMSLNISDGVTVKDNSGNNINIGSKGIIIEDLNGNKIELGPSGVVIEDINSNKIELGASGVNINNGALEIKK